MNWIVILYMVSLAIILTTLLYIIYKGMKFFSINRYVELFTYAFMEIGKAQVPDYTVKEIDDFLTPQECDYLIKLAEPKLETSMVYYIGGDILNEKHRKSDQAWIKDEDDRLAASIAARVASLSGLPTKNQEDLQIVSYPTGGFFNPHYDACDGNREFCGRMDGRSGPRIYTYLIYLNDDFEGGETVFPNTKMSIKPKRGKCVVFQNTLHAPDGRIIAQSLHGGNPVTKGRKWICNKWVHTNEYMPT